jgi:hypothetical protein
MYAGLDGPWAFQYINAYKFIDSRDMKVEKSALPTGHRYLPPPAPEDITGIHFC